MGIKSIAAEIPFVLRFKRIGLIRPHPSLLDSDDRLNAKLTSALLLGALATLAGVIIPIRLITGSSNSPAESDLVFLLRNTPVLIACVAGYALSRTRHYRAGLITLLLVASTITFLRPILAPNPASIRNGLSWLSAYFLICSLVLRTRGVLVFGGLILVACGLFGFWLPPPLRVHLLHVAIYLLATMIFIVIGTVIRDGAMRERRQALAKLDERQTLLTNILETIPHSIFWKNREFEYIGCNKKYASDVGLGTPEDICGKTDHELAWRQEEVDFFRRSEREILETGKSILNLELTLERGIGQNIHKMMSLVPLRDDRGQIYGLLGAHTDMTALRKTEAELAEQQLKMIVSSKMSSLGQMTSEFSHAISNPLTIIQAKAAQLRDRASRKMATPELVQVNAERIEQTVMRIAQIVRSMRAFARDGSNDPFETVSVRRILEDTGSLSIERFLASGISLEIDSVPDELKLECRPVQISEVLLNLLSNAYDALGAIPNSWVKLSVREVGDRIQLSVTDSGQGIPIELQARLMQPFFTTKAAGKGTGLGLSIAHGIVHAHRGAIYIDNESLNTRFCVLLPRKQA